MSTALIIQIVHYLTTSTTTPPSLVSQCFVGFSACLFTLKSHAP